MVLTLILIITYTEKCNFKTNLIEKDRIYHSFITYKAPQYLKLNTLRREYKDINQ